MGQHRDVGPAGIAVGPAGIAVGPAGIAVGPAGARDPAAVPAAATPRPWTIAEVAAELGVTHRTVRFYEDQGLVRPERRGTQRLFHPRDRVRLALVLRGKRLGFDLTEIRKIVDMYDDEPGETGQLRYLLEQIAERRADLEQRRRDIDLTLAELADVEQRCRAALACLGTAAPPRPDASPS